MMRLAVVWILLLSCASPRSRSVEVADEAGHRVDSSAAQPLRAPVTDLTGSWTTGTADPPQVPVIVRHPTCTVIPAVWIIEQEGNQLRAWTFRERYNQGIVRAGDHLARAMPATGTISGAAVLLDDGSYRYVLTYDSASTHLRGTRNGQPFWAARQRVERPEPCLPPPE